MKLKFGDLENIERLQKLDAALERKSTDWGKLEAYLVDQIEVHQKIIKDSIRSEGYHYAYRSQVIVKTLEAVKEKMLWIETK